MSFYQDLKKFKANTALVRALSLFPEILILDEAKNSLDHDSVLSIRNSLKKFGTLNDINLFNKDFKKKQKKNIKIYYNCFSNT